MQTKTFSGRADVEKLSFADALTEREYGISYGQFCSSVLLDHIHTQHALPEIDFTSSEAEQRAVALKRLREMKTRLEGSSLATATSEELKQRIAGRYA